jgi:hypothetical protein
MPPTGSPEPARLSEDRTENALDTPVIVTSDGPSRACHNHATVLPDYWIERPAVNAESATESAIDELLTLMEAREPDHLLDVDTLLRTRRNVAPWTFLCGLAERRMIAFHGTGDPSIESFEPRQPTDFAPFGDQRAVFATSDPVWAMFYAIVDRARYELTLNNGCIMELDPEGRSGVPHYYFSISQQALGHEPWRTGYVYLLPAETFVEQPSGVLGRQPSRVPQLASPVSVTPFARLEVAPSDFPFLKHIRGHDDNRLEEYAQAIMSASPWPD